MAANVRFSKTTVSVDLYLRDTSAPIYDGWYPNEIIIKAGEIVDVMIKEYEDGRTYYTAFKKENGEYFCATNMKDSDGRLILNCGGLRASEEVKDVLEPQTIQQPVKRITLHGPTNEDSTKCTCGGKIIERNHGSWTGWCCKACGAGGSRTNKNYHGGSAMQRAARGTKRHR